MCISSPLQDACLARTSRAADETLPAFALSLIAVLDQLEHVLEAMSDAAYRRKPVGAVASNVGGHVRHSLDHIEALLAGIDTGEVDYDQRQRGTDVETSRHAALAVIARQKLLLLELQPCCAGRRLRLSVLASKSSPPAVVETTVARELAFVLSHTIHHNALIAVMTHTLGIPVPDRFGYAPSTIAHLEKSSCVR